MKFSQTIAALGMLVVFVFTTNVAMAQHVFDFDFNPNVSIPDNDTGGVSDVGAVFGTTYVIEDVDVDLHINHTWQGDLIVEIAYNGVTVPLLYRAGDSDGASFGFGANNFGTADPANRFILDDEAAAAYDSTVASSGNGWGSVSDPGIADVTGSWIPYGQFSSGGIGGLTAFDGMDANGNWTLSVSDNSGADTGSLVSWSLHITQVPEPSSAFVLFMGMGGLAFVRRRR